MTTTSDYDAWDDDPWYVPPSMTLEEAGYLPHIVTEEDAAVFHRGAWENFANGNRPAALWCLDMADDISEALR